MNKDLLKVDVQKIPEVVEVPKVSKMLIVRALVYLVAIINAGAAMFGIDLNLHINQNLVYEGISYIFLIVSMGHGIWKNFNVSKTARAVAQVAKQIFTRQK